MLCPPQESSVLRKQKRHLESALGRVEQEAAARAEQLQEVQRSAEASRTQLELERSRVAVLDKAYKSARVEAEVRWGVRSRMCVCARAYAHVCGWGWGWVGG